MKHNAKFTKSSFAKKLVVWFKDFWRRKRCFIPILTHLFDQITDITVAIQFYNLAITKYPHDYEECGGLNMWYLFIITIASMIFYRLISSLLIYNASGRSKQRLILQLFDCELFRALYINYLCDKTEPCDPQRWITSMEASFESTPQTLVQMMYLVKTNTFTSSVFVVISFLSGIWCIISKLISDDKIISVPLAKTSHFVPKSIMIIDLFVIILIPVYAILLLCILCIYGILLLFQAFICASKPDFLSDLEDCYYKCNRCFGTFFCLIDPVDDDESVKKHRFDDEYQYTLALPNVREEPQEPQHVNPFTTGRFEWISGLYVVRVCWRVFDVSSILFLRTLCWIAIGGTALFVIMLFEAISLLYICFTTKKWDLLFSIVALTNPAVDNISTLVFMYRMITNWMMMILVTVWAFVKFDCPRCTHYDIRSEIFHRNIILFIYIYCWICVVVMPYLTVYVVYVAFDDNASQSRELDKMIEASNFDGILELQLYNGYYGVYDVNNNTTLLMLAFQEKRAAIVSYLLKHTDVWNQTDSVNLNILDYYCKKEYRAGVRSMSKYLGKIYHKYPDLKDANNDNIFICGCLNGEQEIVETFLEIDIDVVVVSRDHTGNNVLDFYVKREILISDHALMKLYEKDQNLVDREGRNAFLCAAFLQDLDVINKFKNIYKDIHRCKDAAGNTMYHYLSKNSLFMEQMNYDEFYTDFPEYFETNGNSPFFYLCQKGKKEEQHVIEELISKYPQLCDLHDDNEYNILDYYLLNHYLLSDECSMVIYNHNPDLKSNKQGMTLFLCSCYHGNLHIVQELIALNPLVRADTNVDGVNGTTVAKSNSQYSVVDYLETCHNMFGLAPLRTGKDEGHPVKILLLGAGNVGKSTIFKQIKFWTSGYSDKERKVFVDHVHDQIVQQMQYCLEILQEIRDGEREELRDYDMETVLSTDGEESAAFIRTIRANGLNDWITQHQSRIIESVECLLKEKAIKCILNLRHRFCIPDTCLYFWDECKRVLASDYVPSVVDVFKVFYRTTGMVEYTYTIEEYKYRIVDTGGQRGERKKWIHAYDNVNGVVFVASLSQYNEVMYEDGEKNAMSDSIELFGDICDNEYLKSSEIILILNKTDLFKDKIQYDPITVCPEFEEFEGDTTSYEETTEYIKHQFENESASTKVYTHLLCALKINESRSLLDEIQKHIVSSMNKQHILS